MPLAYGLAAIALWATLASLTALAGPIPPFQLAALTFGIGTVASAAGAILTGTAPAQLAKVPAGALALGTVGLLGYHVLYFFALQTAPAVEANILNYLWPLLIVLFSALLPARHGGERLSALHIAGAALGFGGALAAMASAGGGVGLSATGPGHLAAVAAAVTWAAYSVASRLYRDVPSTSVIACSGLTAVGAAVIHLLTETPRWPDTAGQWAVIAAMGLGPVGLAFTLWDMAVKRGDIRMVGVVSYLTPLLSTGLLAALGLGRTSGLLWLAAALVTAGAVLASYDAIKLSMARRLE